MRNVNQYPFTFEEAMLILDDLQQEIINEDLVGDIRPHGLKWIKDMLTQHNETTSQLRLVEVFFTYIKPGIYFATFEGARSHAFTDKSASEWNVSVFSKLVLTDGKRFFDLAPIAVY